MYKYLFILITLFVFNQASAQDSYESLFKAVERIDKGPFGLNYLQGTTSRASVKSGKSPGGGLLFQAAFRNETAQGLVEHFDFYTGNLFTTNYYRLMGEFVYADPDGSFKLDHDGLIAKGPAAMAKASQMITHWVLERYYVSTYPASGLARGFATRGIGGSEFEQEYSVYFFNFYLSSLQDPYQYLPAFLLAKQSPLIESNALAESRDLIKDSYDYFNKIYGSSDRRVVGLYRIRNAIHNQISEGVIAMIDTYLQENPWYKAPQHTYLQKIRSLLSDYYNLGPEQILKLAQSAGMNKIANAASLIADQGVSPQGLLQLSEAVAYYRSNLAEIPSNKKAASFAVMINSSQYISKEMTGMGKLDSVEKALILLNCIYTEGYLIEDNWHYFHDEISGSAVGNLAVQIAEIIDVAAMTLEEAIQGPYQQWLKVSKDSTMEHFIDDTLKGSALTAASVMANQ